MANMRRTGQEKSAIKGTQDQPRIDKFVDPDAVVPPVMGLTEGEAKEALKSAGYTAQVIPREWPCGGPGDPCGLVVDVNPKEGQPAPSGAGIDIYISQRREESGGGPGGGSPGGGDPGGGDPGKGGIRVGPGTSLRQRIANYALWGTSENVEPKIHYSQDARRMQGIDHPKQLPLWTDCSAYVTLCYNWAGAPDPNGTNYNGQGYTGTLLRNMRHIPVAKTQIGDIIVWDLPEGNTGVHAVIVVEANGPDPRVVSHGQENGPKLTSFSVVNRWHQGQGHTQVTGLTILDQHSTFVADPPTGENLDMNASNPPTEEGFDESNPMNNIDPVE